MLLFLPEMTRSVLESPFIEVVNIFLPFFSETRIVIY